MYLTFGGLRDQSGSVAETAEIMRWLSRSVMRIASYAGMTAGGGGAGLLWGLTVIHRPLDALGVAMILAAGLSLPRIIESIYKRRPAIIKAKGEAVVAQILARSEAEAQITRCHTRAELLRAGLEAGRAHEAAEMLRQQTIDPDLPEGRRLNDDALAKLLTTYKPRSTKADPGSGPQGIVDRSVDPPRMTRAQRHG